MANFSMIGFLLCYVLTTNICLCRHYGSLHCKSLDQEGHARDDEIAVCECVGADLGSGREDRVI